MNVTVKKKCLNRSKFAKVITEIKVALLYGPLQYTRTSRKLENCEDIPFFPIAYFPYHFSLPFLFLVPFPPFPFPFSSPKNPSATKGGIRGKDVCFKVSVKHTK